MFFTHIWWMAYSLGILFRSAIRCLHSYLYVWWKHSSGLSTVLNGMGESDGFRLLLWPHLSQTSATPMTQGFFAKLLNRRSPIENRFWSYMGEFPGKWSTLINPPWPLALVLSRREEGKDHSSIGSSGGGQVGQVFGYAVGHRKIQKRILQC